MMGGNQSSILDHLPHTWDSDPRDPIFSLRAGTETWGFYVTSWALWVEILMLLFVEGILTALISTLVYRLIVQRQGTITSYLACYGFLLPFFGVIPFYIFSVFRIRHMVVRFCLGTLSPITAMFRTTAAAHGFTPSYAQKSKRDFALYYACPMAICHDPKLDKYVPITTNYMLSHLKVYLTMLLVTGALHSCFLFGPGMLPELGTGPLSADSDWYQLSKIVQPKIWLRNIVIAFFYQSYLTCFGEGLIVAQSLVTGLQTHAIMDNPCLTARSFSDFWGSRWNLVIHQVLKDGVYLPVRKHFPKYVAVLASFVASGLFHEWLLWVFAYDVEGLYGCNEVDNDRFSVHCYQPSFGATSLFFVWQAFLIALEFSFLGRLSFWKHLPDPLVTLLILIIGGCTSHWFTEPYINSRFFLDAQILLNVFKAVK